MSRSLLLWLSSLLSLSLLVIALPTYLQDEYLLPDLITVVNKDSGGGRYYLKSFAEPGLEGDCTVQKHEHGPTYSKDHEMFAPKFFVKGGDLYSMTNSTHILKIVALNITALEHYTEYETDHRQPPSSRYKLQMVDPQKAKKNTGVGKMQYAPGIWSWYGPILLYSFGPQHEELKGSLFYSCPDGVYVDVHNGPPPSGCEPVTLHARNILRPR